MQFWAPSTFAQTSLAHTKYFLTLVVSLYSTHLFATKTHSKGELNDCLRVLKKMYESTSQVRHFENGDILAYLLCVEANNRDAADPSLT